MAKAKQAPKKNAAETNQLTRQINLKSAFGSLKNIDLTAGEKKLCKIAGVAINVEFGDGDYGRWARLIGNFAAVNADTGVIVEATKCILPGTEGEALCDRFAAQLRDDATATLKFAGELFAVPRDGYADEENEEAYHKYDLRFRLTVAPEYHNPALELLGL